MLPPLVTLSALLVVAASGLELPHRLSRMGHVVPGGDRVSPRHHRNDPRGDTRSPQELPSSEGWRNLNIKLNIKVHHYAEVAGSSPAPGTTRRPTDEFHPHPFLGSVGKPSRVSCQVRSAGCHAGVAQPGRAPRDLHHQRHASNSRIASTGRINVPPATHQGVPGSIPGGASSPRLVVL